MALCPAVPCCGKTGPSTALPEPGQRPLSCARTFPSQTEQARPPKSSEHFRETLSLVTLEAAGTGDTVASVGSSPQTPVSPFICASCSQVSDIPPHTRGNHPVSAEGARLAEPTVPNLLSGLLPEGSRPLNAPRQILGVCMPTSTSGICRILIT